jgi:alpha-tubulin suppressor-like RCC1 family protein
MSSSPDQVPALIGFGVNYFQNMGPSTRVTLPCSEDSNITAYKLEKGSGAPWEEADDTLVQIGCTASATMFLASSGKIYTSGTLHGRVESPITRIIIPLPLKCVEIACGRHFGLARMEGGLAVCSWGAGHFGQLGLGHDSAPCINQPTVIKSLLPHVVGAPIARVCAGYWHAMALTESGQIYSWGCNRNSQCGIKPAKDPPTITMPQLVRFDRPVAPRVVKLKAGRSHSVALDDRGGVYCWGSCNYGQCGPVGRRQGGTAPPKQVEALSQVQIADIAAGDAHTLALTGGGRVFGWGGGFEGQLGIGSIIRLNPKPKLVADLDFVAIEAGKEYRAQQKNQNLPQASPTPGGGHYLSAVPKVVSVTATGNCSFAISSSGHVYAWGCNDVENLGIPKPPVSKLTYAEPGLPLLKSSALRQCHTHSFDSSHNIALPQRIDCIRDIHVTSVVASPTFLWCMGKIRNDDEVTSVVGQTLYEVQEGRRQQAVKISKLPIKKNNEDEIPSPQDPPGLEASFSTLSNINNNARDGFRSRRPSDGPFANVNTSTKDDNKRDDLDVSGKSKVYSVVSLDEENTSQARKVFSPRALKKKVARFARRASLGTFGRKGTEEFERPKSRKMKRRSFFGS